MAESSAPIPATRPTATVLWTPTPGGRRARAQRPGQIPRAIARARRTAGPFRPPPVPPGFPTYNPAFFVETPVLQEESFQPQPLLVDMRAREIGTIELHAGLVPAELRSLVELLNLTPGEIRTRGGAA